MKYTFFVFTILFFGACSTPSTPTDNSTESIPEITTESLKIRLSQLSDRAIKDLTKVPFDSMAVPRAATPDGQLEATKTRSWTSGFYPGVLWNLYRYSKNEQLLNAAKTWTAFQEKEKWDTHTHDLGFKIYCSYGLGYELTKDEKYPPVIVQASKTLLKRYNPTVGSIRSWDFNKEVWQFPVIIDNMMNLEMLFEAAKLTEDSSFYNQAYQHALTTWENHFRPNFSSYHVIDYDTLTGDIRNKHTHQGEAHESTWARGQGWGLYGFTMAYRYTKDPRFLQRAKDIAQFIFTHPNLPEDHIPYWDFDANDIPDEPRDASAAALYASALLELYQYDTANQAQYLEWADAILGTLSTAAYQAKTPPFLISQSTGNMPDNSEINVPIIYADYYYVEALLRRLNIAKV